MYSEFRPLASWRWACFDVDTRIAEADNSARNEPLKRSQYRGWQGCRAFEKLTAAIEAVRAFARWRPENVQGTRTTRRKVLIMLMT